MRVKSISGAEIIRDGGSLAAMFRDEHDRDWILFLPLRREFRDGQIRKFGFDEPVLIDARPESRPANTHDRLYGEFSGPSSSLTWDDARQLAVQFESLSATLRPDAAQAFHELCAVIESQGQIST